MSNPQGPPFPLGPSILLPEIGLKIPMPEKAAEGPSKTLRAPAGVVQDGGGLRQDLGKHRYDLLPPEGIDALARHYTAGALKYGDRNWERGMDWGRCFASLQRHAWAWQAGEDLDAETQSHHMIAVAWNAIALYVYWCRKAGTDNRPRIAAAQEPEAL